MYDHRGIGYVVYADSYCQQTGELYFFTPNGQPVQVRQPSPQPVVVQAPRPVIIQQPAPIVVQPQPVIRIQPQPVIHVQATAPVHYHEQAPLQSNPMPVAPVFAQSVPSAPSTAPPQAGTSPADRLRHLNELLGRGLVTKDEYDRKRQEIIGSI
eukprot:c13750_g1_i1.p1 GENE.c13750_g1_i1~~c13750_g1_i1.p1  ORF type:complete len:154 (-),score=23.57 c13750_g1_i1:160-621(-)